MYTLAYYNGTLVCASEKKKLVKKYITKTRCSDPDNFIIINKESLIGEEFEHELIEFDGRVVSFLDYCWIKQDYSIFMGECFDTFNNLEQMMDLVSSNIYDEFELVTKYYKSIIYNTNETESKIRSEFIKKHYLWSYPINLYISLLNKYKNPTVLPF